jgi:hypothetical protein
MMRREMRCHCDPYPRAVALGFTGAQGSQYEPRWMIRWQLRQGRGSRLTMASGAGRGGLHAWRRLAWRLGGERCDGGEPSTLVPLLGCAGSSVASSVPKESGHTELSKMGDQDLVPIA